MCKCQDTTNFKKALRVALSETTETQKMAVWENPESKEIYTGTVEQAETRLKKGAIECYFIPRRWDGDITFKIVDQPAPEPVQKASRKPEASKTEEK